MGLCVASEVLWWWLLWWKSRRRRRVDAARGSRMSFPWVLYRNYYFFEQTEHTPTRHKYGVLPRQSHYEPGQSSDKNPVFAPNTAACTHGESANVLTIGNGIWTHNLPLRKKKWKCGMGDAPQNRTHANAKRKQTKEGIGRKKREEEDTGSESNKKQQYTIPEKRHS